MHRSNSLNSVATGNMARRQIATNAFRRIPDRAKTFPYAIACPEYVGVEYPRSGKVEAVIGWFRVRNSSSLTVVLRAASSAIILHL